VIVVDVELRLILLLVPLLLNREQIAGHRLVGELVDERGDRINRAIEDQQHALITVRFNDVAFHCIFDLALEDGCNHRCGLDAFLCSL
jgi:hypothetical protein